ncbi:thioredoxin domain-containing protein [Nonomuraea mangrovi]|uniref:Thioredoxin domain-containing protein n=1 Tax=Nonomuraea mangrovi TaxID=2316207 RepID=A0ABW4SUN2_9ACTN
MREDGGAGAWGVPDGSTVTVDVDHGELSVTFPDRAADMTSTIACPNCGKRNRVPAAADGVPQRGSCHQPLLPWIAEAGDDTFAEVAERSALPVTVDFWADWFRPCRMVTPALEQVSQDRAGRVKLVDVDRLRRLSERLAIKHIPTLMMMVRGEVVAQRVGGAPTHEGGRWVEDAVKARA